MELRSLLAVFTALSLAAAAPPSQEPLDGHGLAALREHDRPPPSPIRAVYEGEWTLEAHLAKPHDVWTRSTRLTLLDDGAARARLDCETWDARKPESVETESTWLDGERVVYRESAKAPAVLTSGIHAALLRARVDAAGPWRALEHTTRDEGNVKKLGEYSAVQEAATASRPARELVFDPAHETLVSCSVSYGHDRLGDVRDSVAWSAWAERGGVRVPTSLRIEAPGSSTSTGGPETFTLHLVTVDAVADFATAYGSTGAVEAEAAPIDPRAAQIDVAELFPGVVSFACKTLDARTLTVEFDDHLLALGAPLSSALGERIVAAIHERFPAKPVRYVLFGHHHPHYTGGLRAFLAAGATVVATPGNARFAAEIAALPFTIEPDAWAKREPRVPKIESFTGRREFADASQRLVAIDIGSRSSHTDEYVVFHLPQSRALLEDDIGWFAASDDKLSFGPRSRGLRDAIVDQALDVQTLWQLWPLANARPSITFAELDAGVRSAQAPRAK